MATFELKSYIDGVKLYYYYPRGNGAPGLIAICDNGKRYVVEESEDDIKRMYTGQVLWSERIMVADSGMVAWC